MTAGSKEIEIKLRVVDPDEMPNRLVLSGFRVVKGRVFETNTLYDYPDGNLQSRRSILRVRQAGAESVLTFKGPAEASKHKTREELETTLGNADTFRQILGKIGIEPGFRYEKYRTEYARPAEDGVVTLDETPVGWFLELEGQPDWIDRTASDLGFTEAEYITESYGSLYLKHCAEKGIAPALMVFG